MIRDVLIWLSNLFSIGTGEAGVILFMLAYFVFAVLVMGAFVLSGRISGEQNEPRS